MVDGAIVLSSDLVVILGDYFATHRFVTKQVSHAVWAAELARLNARFSVYAILGNRDWWDNINGVRNALAAVQMSVMENVAVLLNNRAHRFWPVGVGDQLARVLGSGRFEGIDNLPGTLGRVTTDDPVILLVHEPDIFTQVPPNVSLTLAGHTYGGHTVLPFAPPMWTPSEYSVRFSYGHIIERDHHVIISGDLGCSTVLLRLSVPCRKSCV